MTGKRIYTLNGLSSTIDMINKITFMGDYDCDYYLNIKGYHACESNCSNTFREHSKGKIIMTDKLESCHTQFNLDVVIEGMKGFSIEFGTEMVNITGRE